ncbi:MAG: Na/Pi cotransporter family protein [Fusobacteriaceae bacterium]|nr:Na/Pi cotransporter family protein [Fusobacteriaceae bacterium]MBN2838214.1 Na/Pi cotransporter family protein [Fusobacteriaceae bacterium]
MNKDILDILFTVIGGLGLFLYGMQLMSDGMQRLAGNRLKKIIGAITDNRIMATLVGVGVTGLVQSSSVTTVMAIGFVNAQLMNLSQALGVVLGANIGTTITGWILVIKIGKYGLPIAGVASIFYLFVKKDAAKIRSVMVFGIGLVFLGLDLMSSGLAPLKEMPQFIEFFHKFDASSFSGVILCAMIGMMTTAIVQSSSATLGITITLASQGLITPETGVALVLGENIGTTITAYLASLGANINAKRTALAHFGFNLIGVCWVLPLFVYYVKFVHLVTGNSKEIALIIATAHTMFNVTNVLLFMPFVRQYAKILIKILPDKGEILETKTTKLDKRILETPAIALELVEEEIYNTGVALVNLFEDFKMVVEKQLDKSDEVVKRIFAEEERIDIVQKEISDIAKEALILELPMDLTLSAKTSLSLADEYESLSDYVALQTKHYLKILDKGCLVGDNEYQNIYKLNDKIRDFLSVVNKVYKDKTIDENVVKITEMKVSISELYKRIRNNYMERFREVNYSVDFVTAYMDILNTYRRMNNHIFHITEILIEDKNED